MGGGWKVVVAHRAGAGPLTDHEIGGGRDARSSRGHSRPRQVESVGCKLGANERSHRDFHPVGSGQVAGLAVAEDAGVRHFTPVAVEAVEPIADEVEVEGAFAGCVNTMHQILEVLGALGPRQRIVGVVAGGNFPDTGWASFWSWAVLVASAVLPLLLRLGLWQITQTPMSLTQLPPCSERVSWQLRHLVSSITLRRTWSPDTARTTEVV